MTLNISNVTLTINNVKVELRNVEININEADTNNAPKANNKSKKPRTRIIDTFRFGKLKLREGFSEEYNRECVEIINKNGDIIADILSYDFDEIDDDIIEEYIG